MRAALPAVPSDAVVIAADGGVEQAERLGLHVDVLIGDLDSADPTAVERVVAEGGHVERHPVDKDASDLELALLAAVAAEVRRIVVVGGDRGRLDHLLGNAALLASDRFADVMVEAVLGSATLWVIRDERSIEAPVGSLLSLFAVGGPATGVSTVGLRWPLQDATLVPGSTLGLSNEVIAEPVWVRVGDGVALAIRPGPEDAT